MTGKGSWVFYATATLGLKRDSIDDDSKLYSKQSRVPVQGLDLGSKALGFSLLCRGFWVLGSKASRGLWGPKQLD